MNHYSAIIMVGIGGGLGAIARYLCAHIFNRLWSLSFPAATFTINILGSFLIGLLLAIFLSKMGGSDNLKLLLITGFCGGYTTFSTFSIENLQLIQNGKVLMALIYIFSSVILGIIFALLGWLLGKFLT